MRTCVNYLLKMDQNSRYINFIFLAMFNGVFFILGIFLNSVVIVALLRSRQHLKTLCSFMILVVTCFDLATVTVCHPLIITSSYIWSTGDYKATNIYHRIEKYSTILFHFSFMALLVMNIDRFLAISYPFFHKQKVTKQRLMVLLGVLLVIILIEQVLAYRDVFGIGVCHVAVLVAVYVLVIFTLNCKIYIIAKKARRGLVTGISTCILAVACFTLFSSPSMIGSAIQFPPVMMSEDNGMLFSLWAGAFACINSSFNCLIFFWKDKSLRQEGAKTLKSLVKLRNIWFTTDDQEQRETA